MLPRLIFAVCVTVSAETVVDDDVQRILAARGSVRAVVALRSVNPGDTPEEMAATLSRGMPPEQFRLAARFRFAPAAIVELRSTGALTQLLANPHVAAIELDSGGYGVFAPATPVLKLARIAIVDTGIPDVVDLAQSNKLAGEACFCRTASGRTCCPDGSAEQIGTNSARESLPFQTTTFDWLRLSPEIAAQKATSVVPDLDPLVTAIRVLNTQDRFDTWEPVFTALDWLVDAQPGTPQNIVLFSFASEKLYRTACTDRGADSDPALVQIWRKILSSLKSQGMEVLITAAKGGPGAGAALPGCIRDGQVIDSSERLPSVPAQALGGSGGPGLGAQRQPLPENGAAARAVVQAVRAARDEETPPIDTPADVRWSVVTLTISDAAVLRAGLRNLAEPGKTVDLLTTDAIDLLSPGRSIKLSMSLVGDEGKSFWFGGAFRLVDR